VGQHKEILGNQNESSWQAPGLEKSTSLNMVYM
jgi:hypothetical protein